jgi:hypothetical protein
MSCGMEENPKEKSIKNQKNHFRRQTLRDVSKYAYFFYGELLWQYHVIECPMPERTRAAPIMLKNLRTQWHALIVKNRASRTEFAPIVVSMQAVR